MKIISVKLIDNSTAGIDGSVIVRYLEVQLDDIEYEVLKILLYLNDMSWLNNLDIDWMKASFKQRSMKTAERISADLRSASDNSLAAEAGEFIVSLNSLNALQVVLKHKPLPLLELIKEQVKGNPGFDFITVNKDILMFGEAKYRSKKNGYGDALSQIERFIIEKKDLEEIAIINDFVDEQDILNFMSNQKGYIAGFSLHSTNEQKLIQNIINNPHFKILEGYNEAIFIGVKING